MEPDQVCPALPVVCEAIRSDPEKRSHFLALARQADEEPDPVAYPSVATMARSAVTAAGRFVASGGAMVTREEHDRRRSICGACEFLDVAQDRCRKCGCYLAVKPWMVRESCPISRW